MLLLVSAGAMVLSTALLIAPAKAVTLGCGQCSALNSKGHKVSANCQIMPIDSCICPLSGTIITHCNVSP